MSTEQSMGINDDNAAESPPASSPKAAPTAGGVTAPGVLSALIDMTARHALTVKENGGCDHSVGICWCDDIRALDAAQEIIRRATGETA